MKRSRGSRRALSLGELIVFLAAGPLKEVLEVSEFDRDGAQDFTRPSSEVSSQFGAGMGGWLVEGERERED